MNQKLLSCAAIAATLLPAQNDQQPPDPKTKAHAALSTLVGDWQSTCKMAAMPGVPGMEKASESTGTEHTELICNGLWLKSTINSTFQGKPFQGVWLVGYDPFAKTYKSIWVSSQDEPDCVADGTYDEKTKAWTFQGDSPMGPVRSTFVWKDANTSVETCWMTADGKETECMQITRKRATPAAPRDAAATTDKPPTREHALLADGVGNWEATVTHAMGAEPAVTEKCMEHVALVCGGRWTWSDFKGNMMGMPFEGHGLTGYDAQKKQFVSYWIDSTSANYSRTAGTYDEAKKTFTLAGTGVDHEGKSMTIQQTYSQKDKDTRHLAMTFKAEQGTHQMEIAYKRTKR